MAQVTKLTRKARRRGVTYVDTLIASMIAVVGIVGTLNLVTFLANMTQRNQVSSVAYNVARVAVETVRSGGFPNYPDGTTYTYYDNNANLVGSIPNRVTKYKVITTASTNKYMVKNGVNFPSYNATRTVTVQVNNYPADTQLVKWGTLLIRGGI